MVLQEQKKRRICLCNEKSLSWWLDGCTSSRFVNEIPDTSVEKNEVNLQQNNDFLLNQDNELEFENEYRSQVGTGIKKINYLNGKNNKTRKFF